jgi:hypothetical protein
MQENPFEQLVDLEYAPLLLKRRGAVLGVCDLCRNCPPPPRWGEADNSERFPQGLGRI